MKEFEEVMVDIKELLGVQDVHRRQLRETTLRSKELERRGRGLRNRLVAAMQSIYGVDNLVLVEFGVEPRLPRRRPRLTPEEKVAKLEAELAAAKAELKRRADPCATHLPGARLSRLRGFSMT